MSLHGKCIGLNSQGVQLVVKYSILIDRLLHILRHRWHYDRAQWLCRAWLELLGGEDSFEPWHPVLEDLQVLRSIFPVQHALLELDTNFGAVLLQHVL